MKGCGLKKLKHDQVISSPNLFPFLSTTSGLLHHRYHYVLFSFVYIPCISRFSDSITTLRLVPSDHLFFSTPILLVYNVF